MANNIDDITRLQVDQNQQRARRIITPADPPVIEGYGLNPGGSGLMRTLLLRWALNGAASYGTFMPVRDSLGAAGKPSTSPNQLVKRR